MAVRPGQPHIEETMSALQFGSRARKIKVHASKNIHKNWKLECIKLQSQLEDVNKRYEKLTRAMIKCKRIIRDGGLDAEISDDDDDDEEGDDTFNGEVSITKPHHAQHGTEHRRRQSLHAAKSHKQALALQMKEMQQTLEAKLAEATSNSQSKDDELDMYKLQCRELKKNGAQLQTLVTRLQEESYTLELEKTELSAKNERIETEVEALEYSIEEHQTQSFAKYAELEAVYKTATEQLNVSHVDLRELELELRKSGSDNEVLRHDMQGITLKHEMQMGQISTEARTIKKQAKTNQDQLKAQLRASDHRHREIVRRVHQGEREMEQEQRLVVELNDKISAYERTQEEESQGVAADKEHVNHVVAVLVALRSAVLSMHMHEGQGADKQLQRITFKRGGDESHNELLGNQSILLGSLERLVSSVKKKTTLELNALWERERLKQADALSCMQLENKTLKEISQVERERTEYALSLVKAIKPLIQQTAQHNV